MLSRPKMMGMAFLAGSFMFPLSPSAQAVALNLSNAEVIVKSSANTAFVAMTNTDANGRFVLKGIPAGGINVLIRRNNKTIAQGARIFDGGDLSEAQILNILVPPSFNMLKSAASAPVATTPVATSTSAQANPFEATASTPQTATNPTSVSTPTTTAGSSTPPATVVASVGPSPIACLFDWAERTYTELFPTAGRESKVSGIYTYRHYPVANAYVGVSSVDNHVYYLGPDGQLQDVGPLSNWLPVAGCQ